MERSFWEAEWIKLKEKYEKLEKENNELIKKLKINFENDEIKRNEER